MVADVFERSQDPNSPVEFTNLNLVNVVQQQGKPEFPVASETTLKGYIEKMGIPNDMKQVQKILGVADELNCDTRPQAPDVTGKPAQDACGIEISKLYPQLEKSVTLAIGEKTTGTAFKVCDDDQCFYVTNNHVAGNRDVVGLADENDKNIEYMKVVARNPESDLVLIEPLPSDSRPGLKVGQQSKEGDSVFTFGHPLGFPKDVINAGRVVDVRAPFKTMDYSTGSPMSLPKAVLSTAHSRPGQSGSPEFNANGEVVGVKVMGMDAGGNFGPVGSVSIPIQDVVKMIEEQKSKNKK